MQASFRLYLRNYGNGDALNVQVEENFAMNFSEPLVVSVFGTPTVSEGPLTVNPDFNGTSEVGLLAGTDTLAHDESGIVEFTIRIELNGIEGPLANRVLATQAQNGGVAIRRPIRCPAATRIQNGNQQSNKNPARTTNTNIHGPGRFSARGLETTLMRTGKRRFRSRPRRPGLSNSLMKRRSGGKRGHRRTG